jgi:hypothetical protein
VVVGSRGRAAALFDLLALFHPASSEHLQLLVRMAGPGKNPVQGFAT